MRRPPVFCVDGRLGANLARRQILPIPRIVFTDQERQAYNQLEGYCQGLAQQVAGHASSRNKVAVGFVTGDEDAGDDEAVAALLHDRTPEDLAWEKQKLDEMLQTLSNLEGIPSKLEAFLRVLEQRRIDGQPGRLRQTVVFTRFLDTLTDLVRRLRNLEPNLRIGTFSGEGGEYFDPDQGVMVSVERDDVKHRFLRGEIALRRMPCGRRPAPRPTTPSAATPGPAPCPPPRGCRALIRLVGRSAASAYDNLGFRRTQASNSHTAQVSQ